MPEVVIVRVEGAMTTDSCAVFVWAGFPASLTFAVKLKVPLAVGVPEMMPVAGDRLSPAGRLPDVIDQA